MAVPDTGVLTVGTARISLLPTSAGTRRSLSHSPAAIPSSATAAATGWRVWRHWGVGQGLDRCCQEAWDEPNPAPVSARTKIRAVLSAFTQDVAECMCPCASGVSYSDTVPGAREAAVSVLRVLPCCTGKKYGKGGNPQGGRPECHMEDPSP